MDKLRLGVEMARRNKSPRLDIVHNDLIGAQKRLSELKGGFSGVSRRWNGPIQLKELFRAARLPGVVAICGALFVWYLLTSPWPPVLAMKHLASFLNCEAADAVGLAPSRRGQPGYWSHNDGDDDGVLASGQIGAYGTL